MTFTPQFSTFFAVKRAIEETLTVFLPVRWERSIKETQAGYSAHLVLDDIRHYLTQVYAAHGAQDNFSILVSSRKIEIRFGIYGESCALTWLIPADRYPLVDESGNSLHTTLYYDSCASTTAQQEANPVTYMSFEEQQQNIMEFSNQLAAVRQRLVNASSESNSTVDPVDAYERAKKYTC